MPLPRFAPIPDNKVRQSIPPPEWELYIESWTALADLYLRSDNQEFNSSLSDESSLTPFLVSLFQSLATADSDMSMFLGLRKKSFLLIHRIFSGDNIPLVLMNWSTLADVSHAFPRSEQLRSVLQSLWKRKGATIEESLQVVKTSLVKCLDSRRLEEAERDLQRLAPLLKTSSDAAIYMMIGSDFLDSLSSAYTTSAPTLRKKLTIVVYLGLTSLMEGARRNYSVLSDHLYSLKNGAERLKSDKTTEDFLADLITNTPILRNVRDKVTEPEGTRLRTIAASLSMYKRTPVARQKKPIRRKTDKGKDKAEDGVHQDIHVHRMSLISQIQDLFADLGAGFIAKLLDAYDDNVEEVVAHLLEESLPQHLMTADRSEQLIARTEVVPQRFSPQQTTLSQRRNVFDNDDFDRLAFDTSRLHIGRRNDELTADNLLSDRNSAPNKSAIFSALAAFDPDDDERDDTYDVEDVGGTVDSSIPPSEELDAHEEELFRAYSSSSSAFGRTAAARKSKERAALKATTSMTDEAIEGWAIMLQRDPRRARRLEARYSTFTGQQSELASTAYRHVEGDESGDEGQGESGGSRRGGRGDFSGRGRGRGLGRGRGRGALGNVAGSSHDNDTQASRHRKEASKGSRANHNRRQQRARKVARAGFPG